MKNLTPLIRYQPLKDGKTGRFIARINPSIGFFGKFYAGRL